MMNRVRTLALAAVLLVAAVGAADAQTVVVTRTTPGLPVELSLNRVKIGSATADDSGIASLDVNLPAHGGKDQTDVHLSIELCAAVLRVQIVEAGLESPEPSEDCTHTDITGTYVMKRTTTFVVDMGTVGTPAVWLTQRKPPKTWLHPELAPQQTEGHVWAPLPKGLVLSGGGGLALFGDVVTNACGSVSNCDGRTTRGTWHGNATMWLTREVGLEVGFMKPSDVVTNGNDTGYSFTNTFQSKFVSIAVKLGVAAGPARIYGFGGEAHHWAISNTSQVVGATTVTVNGVTTTIPGGTYVTGIDAPGWDWLAGGGVEIWIKPPLGIYVEGGYTPIKGSTKNGGEGELNDRAIYFVGGLTFHVFGK